MTLKDQWIAGIARAAKRARFVRGYLIFAFSVPVPWQLYKLWNSSEPQSSFQDYASPIRQITDSNTFQANLWTLIITIFILGLALFLVRRYSTIKRSADDLLELPSKPEFTQLRDTITSLATEMEVGSGSFLSLINARDFGISPSIVQILRNRSSRTMLQEPSIALLLPLGFLKFFAEEPEPGKAILAHELAHIRQQDWELWGLSSAFVQAMKTFVVPLALLFSALALAGIVQLSVIRGELKEAAENLRDYQEVLDSQSANSAATPEWLRSALPSDPRVKLQQTEMDIPFAYAELGRNFVVPLIQLLILSVILRMRAKSEKLADLAAIVYAGPAAITRALLCCGTTRPWWVFMSAHPALHERLDFINRSTKWRSPDASPVCMKLDYKNEPRVKRGPSFLSVFAINGESPKSLTIATGFIISWVLASALSLLASPNPSGLNLSARSFLPVVVDFAFILAFVIALMFSRRVGVALAIAGLCDLAAQLLLFQTGHEGFMFVLRVIVFGILPGQVLFLVLYSLASRRLQFGLALVVAACCAVLAGVVINVARGSQIGDVVDYLRADVAYYGAQTLCLTVWYNVFRPRKVICTRISATAASA